MENYCHVACVEHLSTLNCPLYPGLTCKNLWRSQCDYLPKALILLCTNCTALYQKSKSALTQIALLFSPQILLVLVAVPLYQLYQGKLVYIFQHVSQSSSSSYTWVQNAVQSVQLVHSRKHSLNTTHIFTPNNAKSEIKRRSALNKEVQLQVHTGRRSS